MMPARLQDVHPQAVELQLAPAQIEGAFLGEALLRKYGGQWVEHQGTWGVQLDGRPWISPFHKIDERFEPHRVSDSLADLFHGGPLLQHLREQRPRFP